jgi:hypothetical protein
VTTELTPQVEAYEAPALVVHGLIADLTGAIGPGTNVDHSMPAGALGLTVIVSL